MHISGAGLINWDKVVLIQGRAGQQTGHWGWEGTAGTNVQMTPALIPLQILLCKDTFWISLDGEDRKLGRTLNKTVMDRCLEFNAHSTIQGMENKAMLRRNTQTLALFPCWTDSWKELENPAPMSHQYLSSGGVFSPKACHHRHFNDSYATSGIQRKLSEWQRYFDIKILTIGPKEWKRHLSKWRTGPTPTKIQTAPPAVSKSKIQLKAMSTRFCGRNVYTTRQGVRIREPQEGYQLWYSHSILRSDSNRPQGDSGGRG